MYKCNPLSLTLFCIILFVSSCISSEYLAGTPSEQITDDNLVGIWKLQTSKKLVNSEFGEMAMGMKKIKITINANKSYNIHVLHDGDSVDPLQAFTHKIQGETFVTLRGMDDEEDGNGKNIYYYAKYKIEGKKLLIYPILEKKALKNKEDYDIETETPTKFANEKALHSLIGKNLKNKNENINPKEYYTYVKE